MMLLSLLWFPSLVSAASLQPLTAQTVETLPNGTIEASLSLSYFDGLWYPPFTEPGTVCCQTLLSAPTFGFNIGLGDRVEVQASYELLYLDETILGDGSSSNYGSGDARIGAKIRIISEEDWWPALGVRFNTKLPNANAADHLGTDRIDWGGELLASKTLGPATLYTTIGLQIWDNPHEAGQDDLFSWGVGASSPEITASASGDFTFRLLGEFAGLTGSRFGNDRCAFRGGLQAKYDAFTFFGGVSTGLIRESENIGGMLGVIWTVDAF